MAQIVKFRQRRDEPMLNILDVARYLLSLGSMKHKKLQKICYYIQAWYLACTGQRLMNTEFQAWAHGPVSPVLYQFYRDWGGLTIPQITYTQCDINIPDAVKIYIKAIYDLYKNYTADELERLTHQEEPWIQARKDVPDGAPCTNVISDKIIIEYYKGYINNG